MPTSWEPWSIAAVNLPDHADNPVHTAEGGRAAGYDGAVVAGTTIYAYLTRPAAVAWGAEWVTGGSAGVRFHAPVLEDELVDIVGSADGETGMVEARRGDTAAAGAAFTLGHEPLAPPIGTRLEPLVEVLGDGWTTYASRIGADLPLFEEHRLVHPVVWPNLANRVFATQLVQGSWVHTRSMIRHLGPARPGDTVLVEGFEIDRFTTRSGERAVVDLRFSVDGRPIVAIEHEAIVRLTR